VTAYGEFFVRATAFEPFPFQCTLAGMPLGGALALRVPTGAGKTQAVLAAWLWRRRFHPDPSVRASTPRRLVYCLPMRVLVEQTQAVAQDMLRKLGVSDIGVHPLLGGDVDDDWIDEPERDAILVGTQDMLLSRALNRGYAASRFKWPRLFGMLHNDALWVCDEVQLMGVGLATAAQLEALRRKDGVLGPTGTLFLSATFEKDWLGTADFDAESASFLTLGDQDRRSETLAPRLTAPKSLLPAPVDGTDPKAVAEAVLEAHLPGTLTLVILNRVERATEIYRALTRKPGPPCLLLHSRFRPPERRSIIAQLLRSVSEDRIAVTTQVVEAGLDLDARTLFLDLAPWPSVVQRLGRLNRKGEIRPAPADHREARAFWLDVPDKAAAPYEAAALEGARRRIEALGRDASPANLERQALDPAAPPAHVVRRRDVHDLFDTSPDVSGLDVDVGRFVRDTQERDLQLFWRSFDGGPSDDAPPPHRDELCQVPVAVVRDHLKNRKQPGAGAWLFDHLDGTWQRQKDRDVRPGMRLLLRAQAGGYDPGLGFASRSTKPVGEPPVPAVVAPEQSVGDDRASEGRWVALADHTDDVVAETRSLSEIVPGFEAVLEQAARWHDAGKAHPKFQEFLLQNAPPPPEHGGVWAKSPGRGRHVRPRFRHELASALALLAHVPTADLAAYLAAAHHGKVRVQIRSLPGEHVPPNGARYALGVWDGDELDACDLGGDIRMPPTGLDLGLMQIGGADGRPSWADRTARLVEDLGPFRLSFLEALLRAADARASRKEEERG
jgi:CRISPR-associated endonuclease/helicase Cas3